MATPEFESQAHTHAEQQQPGDVEPQQPNLQLLQGGADQDDSGPEPDDTDRAEADQAVAGHAPYIPRDMADIAMTRLIERKQWHEDAMVGWAEFRSKKK